MTWTLAYHDLISVPLGAIYWLRAYLDREECLAVVTEVPGNPGPSVINGSETILSDIASRLTVDPAMLACYLVIPSGAIAAASASAWRVHLRPELHWEEITVAEIEGALGRPLDPIPPHKELLRRVVAMGGDPEEEHEEPVFEKVAVANLPPPSLPFRCALAERFHLMRRDLGPGELSTEEAIALGQRFRKSLSVDDRRRCRFHLADWRAIADESVRILESSHSQTRDALAEAARASRLPSADRRWLTSLFSHPVVVHDQIYGDGQHRGCALHFSGASEAVAVRAFHTYRGEPKTWTYTDDG